MQKRSFSHPQTGILLLAFGGPRSLDEVEPFLNNIFSGHPLTPSLIDQVRTRYQRIGGKSPLLEITERQARSLENHLRKGGHRIDVHIGMRHWHPYIHESLKAMAEKGMKKVLCLIMSPYSSRATAKGYHDAVHEAIMDLEKEMGAYFASSWHTHPLYLEAVTKTVEEGLAQFPPHRQRYVPIIFSAHGLPENLVKNDPYVDHINATISGIMERFKGNTWYLAFQSRGRGKGKWLSPAIEEGLEIVAQSGMKEVLITPLSFVADHLETLYDLDLVLREKAEALGLQFQRASALNDHPKFIEALTDIVSKSIDQKLS